MWRPVYSQATLVHRVQRCRYRRCGEADHIRRDVDVHVAQEKAVEEQKKLVAEVQYCIDNKLVRWSHYCDVGSAYNVAHTNAIISINVFIMYKSALF